MNIKFDSKGGESGKGEIEIECQLGTLIVTDQGLKGLDIILAPTDPDGEPNIDRVKFAPGGTRVYLWVRGRGDYKRRSRTAIYLTNGYKDYDIESDKDGAL